MSKNLKFTKKILNNGVRVLLIPKKNYNLISMGIFVKAGSCDENKSNNGIAHFLEHMMFKGTKKRKTKDLLNELDETGAYYNASTSKEFTMYEINGNYKDTNLFLDILLDIYLNSTLTKEDIEVERGVIMEEINMYLDNNEEIVSNKLYSISFKNNNLGKKILGKKNNIKNFKKNDFIKFKKENYLPEDTVIVVFGNFEKKKVFNKIKKEMKNLKNSSNEKSIIKKINIQQKPNYYFIKKNLQQTIISIGFKSFSKYEIKNNLILSLISDILTNSFTSILFDILRTKLGLIYYVNSSSHQYSNAGLFVINIGVNNNCVYETIKIVFDELNKLKKKNINKKFLKKAKKLSETLMLFKSENHNNILNRFGYNELFFKEHLSIEKEFNIQKRISTNDIKNISKKIFQKQYLNLVVLGNIESKEKIINLINNY